MSTTSFLIHSSLIHFLLRQEDQADDSGNTGTEENTGPGDNSTQEDGDTTHVVLIILAIILSIALAIFVFVFVRVFYHRRNVRHGYAPEPLPYRIHPILNQPPQAPALVRRQRLANLPGLNLAELAQVAPTTSFSSPKADQPTCPICLDEMLPACKVRILPCNHTFHAKCIEEWSSKANRCPVCNTPIIPDETLHKSRLSAIENPDILPVPSTTIIRQRRRRARNDDGVFQLSTTPPPTPLQRSPPLDSSDHVSHDQ